MLLRKRRGTSERAPGPNFTMTELEKSKQQNRRGIGGKVSGFLVLLHIEVGMKLTSSKESFFPLTLERSPSNSLDLWSSVCEAIAVTWRRDERISSARACEW